MSEVRARKKLLVESALLGHGIVSITNEEILDRMPKDVELGWVIDGKLRITTIDEFINYRNIDSWGRFNYISLANTSNKSGYLTASATMLAAEMHGYEYVISCGIAGICPHINNAETPMDLLALKKSPSKLVATAFKDMIDIDRTKLWLDKNHINFCSTSGKMDGYLFTHKPIDILKCDSLKTDSKLILNPIDNLSRIEDISIMEEGFKYGMQQQECGYAYHPAANKYFDEKSNGYSSKIQLRSLIDNINYVFENC